ncbi:MAG: hypothetical protein ACO3UU_15040, partial [Minisyncoccia bacterium]
TGKRTDTYKVITKAGGGGKACEYTEGQERTVDAKVDCEGSYNSKWTDCTATCGGGTQKLTYNPTVTPLNGGKACPATQSQSCNTHSCVSCKEHDQYLNWKWGGVDVVDPTTGKKCSDYKKIKEEKHDMDIKIKKTVTPQENG